MCSVGRLWGGWCWRRQNCTFLIRTQENTTQAFENLDLEFQRLGRNRAPHLGLSSIFVNKPVGTGDMPQGKRGQDVHPTSKGGAREESAKYRRSSPSHRESHTARAI